MLDKSCRSATHADAKARMDMLAELHKRVMRNVPADANDGRELAVASVGGHVYRKATHIEVREL